MLTKTCQACVSAASMYGAHELVLVAYHLMHMLDGCCCCFLVMVMSRRFADRLGLGKPFDFTQGDMNGIRVKVLHRLVSHKI